MKKQKTLDDEFIKETPKVKCEICGREFEFISSTHLKTHGITTREYRDQFPDAPLMSEGLRKKTSESKLGEKNPFFGHKHTEESKQKISEATAGENNGNYGKRGEETSMFGKHLTELRKQHISEAVSGEKHGMFGVHRCGEDAPNYGNHQSEEAIQKISKALKEYYTSEEGQQWLDENRRGENHQNYKGGRNEARKRREEKRRGFGFIPLNDKFPGTEAHHLDKELVLYIPKELHQSVWHNMFTGQGMEEINNLACEYVYGIEIDGGCLKTKRVEK